MSVAIKTYFKFMFSKGVGHPPSTQSVSTSYFIITRISRSVMENLFLVKIGPRSNFCMQNLDLGLIYAS